MRRTVVVGDVHGCIEELEELLRAVALRPTDRLVSVGDLVGKGPDGAAVVRFFRQGGHEAVRGNHDEKLLAWRRGDRTRPLTASHAADAAALTEDDWTWLAARPLVLRLPEHAAIVVHGGLVPGLPLDEQPPRMLMNLRSIEPDGTPSTRLDAGAPWAEHWPGPELVIFGHDAVRGRQDWPHAIGLDSGCVYGGALSALLLPDRQVITVPSRQPRVFEGAS